jgi:hypothetical protein
MSVQGFNSGPLTYLAGVLIGDGLLATLTGTAGTVGLCGAAGVPVGIADGSIASGAYGCFRPLRGRVRVYGTIAAGNFCKAGINGTVVVEAGATTRTANTIGQAETAATAGFFWMVCL